MGDNLGPNGLSKGSPRFPASRTSAARLPRRGLARACGEALKFDV